MKVVFRKVKYEDSSEIEAFFHGTLSNGNIQAFSKKDGHVEVSPLWYQTTESVTKDDAEEIGQLVVFLSSMYEDLEVVTRMDYRRI